MITINKDKCIKCGQCINDCMPSVLEFDNNNIPQAINPERCIKCQHCLSVCPVGALTFEGNNPDNSDKIQEKNPEELLNLIKSRRSYRQYKKENIEPEIMTKLKDMLNWVPTGVNNHRLVFSFIDDVKVMDDFREKVNKMLLEKIKDPNVNTDKFARYQKPILEGKDILFRGAPHFVTVFTPVDAPCSEIDPIIALSYFELYAQSLGLATCWCGLGFWILNLIPELLKELGMPEGYKLGYCMLFGPAKIKYQRCTQPKPYKIISVK